VVPSVVVRWLVATVVEFHLTAKLVALLTLVLSVAVATVVVAVASVVKFSANSSVAVTWVQSLTTLLSSRETQVAITLQRDAEADQTLSLLEVVPKNSSNISVSSSLFFTV
jgi:hypothetical protein